MKAKKVKKSPLKNWCSQCGNKLISDPCGPTHIAMMYEILADIGIGPVDPSLAAKVEEVRKWCSTTKDRNLGGGIGDGVTSACETILRILNTPTPPAKGARRNG